MQPQLILETHDERFVQQNLELKTGGGSCEEVQASAYYFKHAKSVMKGMESNPAVTLYLLRSTCEAGLKSYRDICCTGGRLTGQLIHYDALISCLSRYVVWQEEKCKKEIFGQEGMNELLLYVSMYLSGR